MNKPGSNVKWVTRNANGPPFINTTQKLATVSSPARRPNYGSTVMLSVGWNLFLALSSTLAFHCQLVLLFDRSERSYTAV